MEEVNRSKYCAILEIDFLKIDHSYQRLLRESVSKIALALDMKKFGVPTVSKRNDGFYYIVDGQHRVEALRRYNQTAEKPITSLWCEVLEGLTVEDEANLFSSQAVYRTAIRAYDKLKAARVSHNKNNLYVIIDNLANEYGIEIASDGGLQTGLRCIDCAVSCLQKSGEEAIRYIFKFYKTMGWKDSLAAYGRAILRMIYKLYQRGYNLKDMVKVTHSLSLLEFMSQISYTGREPSIEVLANNMVALSESIKKEG